MLIQPENLPEIPQSQHRKVRHVNEDKRKKVFALAATCSRTLYRLNPLQKSELAPPE